MIKLSKMSDHALNLCAQLAIFQSEWKNAGEWAKLAGLRESTASKLFKLLCKSDICESERGKAGGYRMAADPGSFTILNVVEAVDGPLSFSDCGLRGKGCSKSGHCAVEPHAGKVAEAIRDGLRRVPLSDLAKGANHVQ